RSPADRLCKLVDCTDAQRGELSTVLARPQRDPARKEAHESERSAANKQLADAFRGENFAGVDFDRHRAQRPARPDHTSEGLDKLAEIHRILTAEQRATLADRFERGGMPFLGGKSGHGGKPGRHAGEQERKQSATGAESDRDQAQRLAHRVESLCEGLSCTDAQREQLASLSQGHKPTHDAVDKEARKAERKETGAELATAFRAETFDRAVFEKAAAKREDARSEHEKVASRRHAEMLVGIHGVLTPEQRETLATKIEAGGPAAVIGGKRGKRGKHGEHGKRGKQGKHGK